MQESPSTELPWNRFRGICRVPHDTQIERRRLLMLYLGIINNPKPWLSSTTTIIHNAPRHSLLQCPPLFPNRCPPPSTTTARHYDPKWCIAGPRHPPVNELLVVNNHHGMNDVARPRNNDDAARRWSPPDVLRRLTVTTHVVTVCIRLGCQVTTRHDDSTPVKHDIPYSMNNNTHHRSSLFIAS
ncbi:hypothetical protein K443DRAFT_8261 [Laccaria amethystina LaAM-08-1]|uniref:Uncharacterized protein n=1 Tax=Laccaria amethystina LaAM-08-1 TaxID=1095629 RepID=A0A0C9XDI5_9AGAR|nr:hypothetical protein K443DRAFT_8261 [Laccaria amethystina LaAM-08-1]